MAARLVASKLPSDVEPDRHVEVDGAGSVFVAGDGDASWGTPLRPYTGGGDAMVARVDPRPSVVEVPTLPPAMLGLLALALLGVALGVLRRGP